MAATGKIKMYDDKKGFGFIIPDTGSPDLFRHISDVKDKDAKPIEIGQLVRYETITGRSGKPAAGEIIRIDSE